MSFKRIAALFILLLVWVSSASGFFGAQFKTASGDFFSETPDCVGFDQPGAHSLCRENGCYVYETASGSTVWTKFDPLGLRSRMSGGKLRAHQAANDAWRASGGYTGRAKAGGAFVANSFKENFTDPAGLISGGVKGEFGSAQMNASAIGIGTIALSAAVIETGLDVMTGGATKPGKQALKTGARELGESMVESSMEKKRPRTLPQTKDSMQRILT